ncbi:hypothetical protein PHAVU_010G080000 [Phaseolus vulgaris]|uniref:Pectinesterase n=1 Tax=Phaseolus vulgaris TaxID=3885 RepID=V7ARI2_PHAVU|nr:hypothetical protein PHAVU_010G080000g [Phaseolus vulgaris]ESW06826.1 hypothetical protein PHAVU_010G080000g [Phaseolus vulgaris]
MACFCLLLPLFIAFQLLSFISCYSLNFGATKLQTLNHCGNPRETTAWANCVELYEQTIRKLNETLDPNIDYSQVDAQAWLSTTLTNLEACKAGFYDLGVQDYVLPFMSNNVTKLLSSTLALNKVQYEEPIYKDGFPTWVKPSDRKLVAKDGSAKYTIVSAAINAAPKSSSGMYVIYVKSGVYNEQVEIKAKNIMLVGDGIGKTIIIGSKSVGGGITTFRSATVVVLGDGFVAQAITFRNTAGAENHQVVALCSGSDLSVFYKCSFEGYQDTLYVHYDRNFYRECDIYGTIDFIFGNVVVTYLGRPWKQYSRTVFMKTYLDGLINPAGWLEWSEYMNTDPGSSTARRVKWKVFRVMTMASEASKFIVANFITGNTWLPSTIVPFISPL